ncbi:NADP-dependent glyceraldehyde-3-phosphate dehydrogenase [Senna tora]|uniref:NADP-dependent glyceraldehyde-3-phosphate dehydrogenase n=1 Tax=Senna tora TaxID=362788 RepID=A0A834T126_9FABA|nr:NADP-dependent glyceraldehyde-3-phosphate dehydrogenase [Senna tora]
MDFCPWVIILPKKPHLLNESTKSHLRLVVQKLCPKLSPLLCCAKESVSGVPLSFHFRCAPKLPFPVSIALWSRVFAAVAKIVSQNPQGAQGSNCRVSGQRNSKASQRCCHREGVRILGEGKFLVSDSFP